MMDRSDNGQAQELSCEFPSATGKKNLDASRTSISDVESKYFALVESLSSCLFEEICSRMSHSERGRFIPTIQIDSARPVHTRIRRDGIRSSLSLQVADVTRATLQTWSVDGERDFSGAPFNS